MAYLGDAVYELYVREYLINKGISNVNDLSAISEENAASTEETSASAIEISELTKTVKNNANDLLNIAKVLESAIAKFKI